MTLLLERRCESEGTSGFLGDLGPYSCETTGIGLYISWPVILRRITGSAIGDIDDLKWPRHSSFAELLFCGGKGNPAVDRFPRRHHQIH
jgi:hypothetical protein